MFIILFNFLKARQIFVNFFFLLAFPRSPGTQCLPGFDLPAQPTSLCTVINVLGGRPLSWLVTSNQCFLKHPGGHTPGTDMARRIFILFFRKA